jgi:hypothetical protein
MNYEQLVRKINSAGAWFIVSFMGEFVINYPKFCDDQDKRNEFAEYIQAEYGKALDYEYSSTRTKCSAIISIIEAGKVIEALQFVLQTNDKKVIKESKENAQALLDAISVGKIVLPEPKTKINI